MITREDQVEQSVQNFVRAGLVAAGYGDTIVNIRDSFPSMEEREQPLTMTQVAVGFNFDDGGRKIEMGSDLTMRVYTIEFWVFGKTRNQGRNVANVIRTILEDNGMVPLQDIGQAGSPIIDQLLLADNHAVTVTKQISGNPRPWDLNVYTTTVKIEDIYYPSLVN